MYNSAANRAKRWKSFLGLPSRFPNSQTASAKRARTIARLRTVARFAHSSTSSAVRLARQGYSSPPSPAFRRGEKYDFHELSFGRRVKHSSGARIRTVLSILSLAAPLSRSRMSTREVIPDTSKGSDEALVSSRQHRTSSPRGTKSSSTNCDIFALFSL